MFSYFGIANCYAIRSFLLSCKQLLIVTSLVSVFYITECAFAQTNDEVICNWPQGEDNSAKRKTKQHFGCIMTISHI